MSENTDKLEGYFDIIVATLFFELKFQGIICELLLLDNQSEFDPKKEDKRIELNNELAELQQQRNVFMNEVSEIMSANQKKKQNAKAGRN